MQETTPVEFDIGQRHKNGRALGLRPDGSYYIVGFPPEEGEPENDWLLAVHRADVPLPDGAVILGSGARLLGELRIEALPSGRLVPLIGRDEAEYVMRRLVEEMGL